MGRRSHRSLHDEHVVHREDVDRGHTLRRERVEGADVPREVRVARRGESAGDADLAIGIRWWWTEDDAHSCVLVGAGDSRGCSCR